MKPNDQRNFVHKRIIGAATGFISGGIGGAIGGAITGGRRRGGAPTPRAAAPISAQGPSRFGRGITAFAQAQTPCPPGKKRFPDGHCHGKFAAIVQHPGGSQGALPFGDAFTGTAMTTTGIYSPTVDLREVRECLPGDILGRDGFCHRKGSIPNKERAYPRGRRPLGTPGEMAALAKAARFGKRMESAVKRMQDIGVLKKPSKSRRRAVTTAAQHHAGG